LKEAEKLSPHRSMLNQGMTAALYPFINTPLPSRVAGSFFGQHQTVM